MAQVNHILYHDYKDAYPSLKDLYERHGGRRLVWRLNVRTHGDYNGDDSTYEVDLVGNLYCGPLLNTMEVNPSTSLKVIGQEKAWTPDKPRATGYYLRFCHGITPVFSTVAYTYFFLDLNESNPKKYKEIMKQINPSEGGAWRDRIVGVFEMIEDGFK